jgi:hypothetical protein
MARLTVTKVTSLILHTEDYNNAGLKQSDIMERIKKEIGGVCMVEEFPINSNIQVHFDTNNESVINMVFYKINILLEFMLMEHKKLNKFKN